ncbi:MAG: hypothetical protein U0744_00425 [Gemmataceae bacterium]
MVIGYHVILSAYGFWLPNDPRSSWSDFVRDWELRRFGTATKVDTRQAAKDTLSYPPVSFNGLQAQAIGRGFMNYVEKSDVVVYACAILPEHVHLVLGRHSYKVEQVAILLKGAATKELKDRGIHPFADHMDEAGETPGCWGRRLWKVFLDEPNDIERSVGYVERNPEREGKPRQKWSFVTAYGSPTAPR